MLIPYRVHVPTDQRPWINIGIVVLITFISMMALMQDDAGLYKSLAGLDRSDRLPLPILSVTSALLHAGGFHLVGNMVFLLVFGNAVEYKFRHLPYLALFLGCAFASGMVHYMFNSGPFVGASGAVSGIMGAFLVFFPRNDTDSFLLISIYIRRVTVSSFWIILSYIAWDIISVMLDLQPGVALEAHLGGFAAGFGVAFTCAYMGWLIPEDDEQTLLQMLNIKGRYKKEFVQY
jgi:membrane associated rhomboid family serine protease